MTVGQQASPRILEFERCLNFRDLGGYEGLHGRRVRWRRLFRSMTPEFMSEADLQQARALGIGLVIDMRGSRYTSGPLADPPVQRVAVGSRRAWRWDQEALDRFRESPPEVALPAVLDRLGRTFARAVAAMADEDVPVLFHCRLGKDRSGVLAAVLLKLLGVRDTDVIADYLMSGDAAASAAPIVTQNGDDPRRSAARVVREPAQRAAMESLLARLREEGGAYAYLRKHGVPKYKLQRLIERLLEPGARDS